MDADNLIFPRALEELYEAITQSVRGRRLFDSLPVSRPA